MKKGTIEKIKSTTIVVLVLIIVFGASYFISELKECNNKDVSTGTSSTDTNSSNAATSTDSDISEDEQGDLDEIGIDEYLDLLKDDEASIIYVARPTCHYCQEMEPIVRNVVYEYNVKVHYLNTDELDDEGQADFIKSNDYFDEKGGYGTPMLIIVKDNDFVDVIEGLTDKDTVVNFFKDNGIIEE